MSEHHVVEFSVSMQSLTKIGIRFTTRPVECTHLLVAQLVHWSPLWQMDGDAMMDGDGDGDDARMAMDEDDISPFKGLKNTKKEPSE